MGQVYQAEDLTLKEQVALKFLRPDWVSEKERVERFRTEVRTARRVSHRNVCRVYDIGEFNGHPFLSMEYITGSSLAERLAAEGRPRIENAVRIALQLCWGLEAIHRKGIIHRDLKPANVMLDEEREVKITDFGLAGAIADLAAERRVVGTPNYMAPEQVLDGRVSQQSDLYSLGLVLYELFTGQPMYRAETWAELIKLHEEELTAPSGKWPSLDPDVEGYILHSLARDPEDRPESVRSIWTKFVRNTDWAAVAIMEETPLLKMLAPVEQQARKSSSRDQVRKSGAMSSDELALQPFISRRAVWGKNFLGRESELRLILGSICNGESTIVVGENHSGKSSLLRHLKEEKVQEKNFQAAVRDLTFYWIDGGTRTPEFTPKDFWKECLQALGQHRQLEIREALEQVSDSGYERSKIEHFFMDVMYPYRQRLVLLIDEFAHLVELPNFKPREDFFALLRSIGKNTACLPLVLASCVSVQELHNRSELSRSYFTHMYTVPMKPFDEGTVDQLLKRAGNHFSENDRIYIRRYAGRNPYLLQTLASRLYELPSKDGQIDVAHPFYKAASTYFEELWEWDGLDDRCRTVLLVVGLAEWAGRSLGHRKFYYSDIGKDDSLERELSTLKELGMVEHLAEDRQFKDRQSMVWKQQHWGLGVEVLSWWIKDVAIRDNSHSPNFQRWLLDERYRELLTREEWEALQKHARRRPSWAPSK
jgi:serine/threonine protein kinase